MFLSGGQSLTNQLELAEIAVNGAPTQCQSVGKTFPSSGTGTTTTSQPLASPPYPIPRGSHISGGERATGPLPMNSHPLLHHFCQRCCRHHAMVEGYNAAQYGITD